MNIINNFNLFSRPINLKYKGTEKFGTLVDLVLSIVVFIIFIMIFFRWIWKIYFRGVR